MEMEEAYSELYQQFLRLRSLCLRQAALLQQLTTALQKQQGATFPNGESGDMISIPVQCTQEGVMQACLLENPKPLTATAHGAAARRGNEGTLSDLLAEDMSKLHVDGPRQRKENWEMVQNVAPLLSMDSLRWQEASFNVSKNQYQAGHLAGDRKMHTMPATGSSSLVGGILNETDGMLLSDVVLQSHVCEFCQAVFPGDTTTRGEFLRHLHTHVT